MSLLLMNKKAGQVYKHIEGLSFKNLETGVTGEITKEIAQKHLAIPVELNVLADKNPAIVDLIESLGLCVHLTQKS